MSEVAVKVWTTNGELRRFQTRRAVTWLELLAQLKVILQSETFQVKYIDCEQDEISLSSESELREAIADIRPDVTAVLHLVCIPDVAAPRSGRKDSRRSLRHRAADKAPQSVTRQEMEALLLGMIPALAEGVAAHLRKDASVARNGGLAQTPVIHSHVICDHCNGPVCGIRYKCAVCADFDLCEACETLDIHDPGHVFYKFDTPVEHHSRRRQCPTRHPRGTFFNNTDFGTLNDKDDKILEKAMKDEDDYFRERPPEKNTFWMSGGTARDGVCSGG